MTNEKGLTETPPDDSAGWLSRMTEEDKKFLWGRRNESTVALSHILEETTYKPIMEDIRQRFGDREIGWRSVLVSLEGDVECLMGDEAVTVRDYRQIYETGMDKPGDDYVNISPIGKASELDGMHEQVGKFLIKATRNTLVNASRETREKVTPALVVYDLSPDNGMINWDRGYKHKMPDDPEKRSRVVLGVYRVDVTRTLPEAPAE